MTTLIRFDGLVAEQLPARSKSWRDMNGTERAKHRVNRINHARTMRMLFNPCPLFVDFQLFVAWRNEPELVSVIGWRTNEWELYAPLHFIQRATTTENIVARVLEVVEERQYIRTYIDSNPEVLRAVKARAPALTVIQMRPIVAAPIKEKRKAK